ncbi:hypothetical protein ACIGW0_22055 [Streptomyces bikiniensis]|uniref:Uncharacterized protein n=1 Tax=Streptomyces bikiniensis TaxID=1896 RepID=A0ABW8CWY6_STRBI
MTTNTPGTAVAEAAWRELLASYRVSADVGTPGELAAYESGKGT